MKTDFWQLGTQYLQQFFQSEQCCQHGAVIPKPDLPKTRLCTDQGFKLCYDFLQTQREKQRTQRTALMNTRFPPDNFGRVDQDTLEGQGEASPGQKLG